MRTPCGLVVPQAEYLRLPNEIGFEVRTAQGGEERGCTRVTVLDVVRGGFWDIGDEIHARIMLAPEDWMDYHDEHCGLCSSTT